MKKIAAIVLSVGVLLGTAGCVAPPDRIASEVPAGTTKLGGVPFSPTVSGFEQPLPDGRKVVCVWAGYDYRNGGLSCDWANAK